MKRLLSFGGLLLCAVAPLLAQRGAAPAAANPFLGKPEAVIEGETLYNQHCTTCHGAGGGGGDIAPAIVSGDRFDIGVSDAQTFNIIKNGVAGTPMSPQRLPEADIWKVVTYIHALRGTAIDNPVPGDVGRGGCNRSARCGRRAV